MQFKGGSFAGSDFLNGGTLVNTGTLGWTNAYVYDGVGSVISNAPGATIYLTASGQGTVNEYGNPQTFYNAGQLTVVAGSTSVSIGDTFINTGTVTVNAGTLDLTGGGTNTSTITVAANGALQFDSPYTASAASSITGAGTTIFNSGMNLTGTYNVGTNIFSGATVNLSGSYTINQVVTISAGAVNFNAGGTLTITALNMSGGTLGGTLLVPVNGPFNWSGGTINGVTVQFKGGSFAGSDFLNGGTLVNTGTLAWNDADVYDGAGSVISNALGGTINLTANSDGTFNGYGSPQTFYNAGQLTVVAGSTWSLSATRSSTPAPSLSMLARWI